jgi:hypothetical protein
VEVRLLFCRFTQLGLLRLLSAETVMGDEGKVKPIVLLGHER